MIRGVNRQVIEVNKTGSIYFERALLVVNPVFSDTGKNILETEAKEVMKKLGQQSDTCKKIRALKRLSVMLAAGSVGAVIAAVILMLV